MQKKNKDWPSSREAVCTNLTWCLKSLIWTVRMKSSQVILSALRCFKNLVKLSLLRFVKVHHVYNPCLCLSTGVCPSGDTSPQKTSLVVHGDWWRHWNQLGRGWRSCTTFCNTQERPPPHDRGIWTQATTVPRLRNPLFNCLKHEATQNTNSKQTW